MTVLFDLLGTQALAGYRFHGGAEYCKQVFHHAIAAGIRDFDAVYNSDLEFDQDLLDSCRINGISLVPVTSHLELPGVLSKGSYQTFFSGVPYPYADIDTRATRFVMVIHGLRNLEMPCDPTGRILASNHMSKIWHSLIELRRSGRRREMEKRRLRRLLLRNGAEIVTDSRHSMYSIKSYFPEIVLDDMRVMHPPIDDFGDVIGTDGSVGGEYYLLLGAGRWIKNASLACHVLDDLISECLLRVSRVLVLGCDYPRRFKSTLKNPDHFEVRGYVDRSELARVYREAFCLIYPSFNEGFGYPPVNSMQFGTPVVASSASSIPEVCADAALYFDPCSLSEMRNRILQIDSDDLLYAQMVSKGRRRFAALKEIGATMITDLLRLVFEDTD
jgi:glycosyltransferase involved in cell wall biosynthesis